LGSVGGKVVLLGLVIGRELEGKKREANEEGGGKGIRRCEEEAIEAARRNGRKQEWRRAV